MLKVCLICKKKFKVTPNRSNAKYCSRLCYGESKRGKAPHNKGLTLIERYGSERAKEISKNISKGTQISFIKNPGLRESCFAHLKGKRPHNYQERETRTCACGCGETFVCRSKSSKKYIWGHNSSKKSCRRNKITSYETKILDMITKYSLPYQYTGNGSFWITSEGKHLNPDFVNVNGSKVVIEVFSEVFKRLYHKNGVEGYIAERSRLFNNFGWRVVFLDDTDLFQKDWEDHCLRKIKNVESVFENSKH